MLTKNFSESSVYFQQLLFIKVSREKIRGIPQLINITFEVYNKIFYMNFILNIK